MSASSFPVLNPDYIKTEESAGHKVSPFALRIEALTKGERPQLKSTAQAVQFGIDAVIDDVNRILIASAAEVIAHPDSNPLSTSERKDT